MAVISCCLSGDAAGAQWQTCSHGTGLCINIENNVTAGPQPTQLDSLSSAGCSEEQGSPGAISAMSGENHGEGDGRHGMIAWFDKVALALSHMTSITLLTATQAK